MANIELVIKVDTADYEYIKNGCIIPIKIDNHIYDAIRNGTPLPKGHGKIGDIDELHNTFKKACDAYNIDNLAFISDVEMNFDLAHTIIKADKENEG